MSADTLSRRLHDATLAIAASGGGLMRMVLPADRPAERWRHYPADDAVDPVSGAQRCFVSRRRLALVPAGLQAEADQ